jgi:ABC-type polysaccharide/polyol phosphate export permease
MASTRYSVESLPEPWQELSHVNPLFYVTSSTTESPRATTDNGFSS